jgi:hypothetical protein
LKDIKFKNPKMTLEEAKKAAAHLGVASIEKDDDDCGTPHWI